MLSLVSSREFQVPTHAHTDPWPQKMSARWGQYTVVDRGGGGRQIRGVASVSAKNENVVDLSVFSQNLGEGSLDLY